MGQKAKIDTVILVILLLLSLIGALGGFYYFQKERLKVFSLNAELEALKVEKRIAETKLAESQKKLDELNTQLKSAQAQIEKLNSELQQAKSEKTQFYSQVEELKLRIQKQEKIEQEWEAKLVKAEEEIDKLQALLKTAQIDKESLQVELKKLKPSDEVTLGKILVEQKKAVEEAMVKEEAIQEAEAPVTLAQPAAEPDLEAKVSVKEEAVEEAMVKEEAIQEAEAPVTLAQPAAEPALEAKVLEVNKDYGFVLINLGSRDGLSSGEGFSVYRQGSYVGDIQVERIQEAMSACGFLSKEIQNRIKQGDEVTLGKIEVGQKKAVEAEAEAEAATIKKVAIQEEAPVKLTPPQAASSSEGKILVINKDYNFVVINLGSLDGVELEDIFLVYQNDSYIGDIQVAKTTEIMSACTFVSEEIKDKIREGDKAIRK